MTGVRKGIKNTGQVSAVSLPETIIFCKNSLVWVNHSKAHKMPIHFPIRRPSLRALLFRLIPAIL
ncbi:MAG TPA: hypothetical protein DCQ97_09225 [Chitinophagaceae bacterium]|nr:hypothetical protein [Chitinophagaceae bacterium]